METRRLRTPGSLAVAAAHALRRAALLLVATMAVLVAAPVQADSTDPRIIALAASLGNNPAQIFAYVRDQVGIDLYSGSLRGSRGTLASKAGSPLDRAALAVDLLRAAGYTAHYAQGTLSSANVARVIGQMFPASPRMLGCNNPGAVGDPLDDYQLNQWASAHSWAEYKPTPAAAYVAFDPTFPDAVIGTANTTATTTFDTIPDAQMQKVRFRVVAETYSQAGAIYGFPLGSTTVLDQTFNAADLVDKPVTFGHFVSQTTLPGLSITASTNTYSPYMLVGDSTVDPRNYQVIRGTDYAETLTNFPLGSTILTGVFVDMDVIDPANPGNPQTTQRALVDRIGYATRQNGGTINYTPSPDNGPALTALDLLTVQVAPSKQALDDFPARQARLATLQAASASIAAAVAALPTPDQMTPDDVALATQAVALNRASAIALLELTTATYEGAAGVALDRNASLYLTRPILASPRLTVARSSLANSSLAISLDVRRNPVLAYALPGISTLNAQRFQVARGLTESTLEGTVLTQITGQPATTIVSLFNAQPTPSAYVPLTSANIADVDTLALSADAKARIRDTLGAGHVVLAPRAPVTVNSAPLTAWLDSDPTTGATISTFEDGTHGALVEYTAIYFTRFGEQNLENTMAKFVGNINSLSIVSLAYMAGLLDSIAANTEFRDSFVNTKAIISAVMDNALGPIFQYLKVTTAELEISGPYGQAYALVDGLLEGLETFDKALKLALGDPPVLQILLDVPSPALPAPSAPGAGPGVTVTLTQDTRFVLPYSGAELGSVYLAQVKNTGPGTDTFRLTSQSADSPFVLQTVAPPLTLAAGATGEVNVCVTPLAAVPAPGTPITFGFVAASTVNPSTTATAGGTFTTPAASAAQMRILPGSANVLAGQSTNATLTIDSLGNASTTIALTANSAPGLTVGGLPASVTLAPGTSRSLPLTFSVATGTPAGTPLATLFAADFGGTQPAAAAFAVTVISATTQCTVDAASAANALARSGLGASLVRLAGDMDALRATPDSAVALQAVLTELDYLDNQQFGEADEAYLAPYATSLGALRTALAGAAPAAVPGILTQIDSALCNLRTTLTTASQGDFSLTLAPATAINVPSQVTTVNINVSNAIATPRVFDIAVAGVPANVTATLNTPTITVPASYISNGCCGSPPLSVAFTNTDGQARAFTYTVTATPRDQPASARTVNGQLALRPDLVRVVGVSPSPAYGTAGTVFTVQVHAMNSLNTAQSFYADWAVLDRNGVTRASNSTAGVPVASGDGLFDLPPFTVNTTGFADGTYTVNVTLRSANPCCDVVPGGTGQGAFIVGLPFSALLSVAPQDLPPGDSNVGLTLALAHDSLPTPSIVAEGAMALPAAARSIARAGNYLYACQEDRVSVIDATNPEALASVATFATGVLASTYGSVGCNVNGTTLVLAYSGDTATSFDTVKIVAFDIGGANATAPVQLNGTPVDTGKLFGGSILFDGTTGYLPTSIFTYNPFSNFIYQQNGNLLALDFSTPSAPTLTGELFHHFPPPSTDTNDPVEGGPNLFGAVDRVGGDLYVATSTSTGGGVDTGVGRLDVVDATALPTDCPGATNPCILAAVDVPEARLLFGVAHQGNTLVAAGDTTGYYDGLSGLDGNLTITAFDVSNPASPVVKSTLVTALRNNRPQNLCNENAEPGGATLTALDNQFYAVGGFNPASCSWVMTLVDASDPTNLRVIPYDVTDVLTSTLLSGSTLYALTRTGILAYDYAILAGPAITANVDMAKGNGVSVVSGSFNLAPTTVDTSATDHDRYTWVQPSTASITWQAHVTGMQPGETRTVASGGVIDFTLPSLGTGTLPVNAVAVVSDQSLSIAPAAQTVGLGRPATYTITLDNPTSAAITYTLAVEGVDPAWVVSLDSPVSVPANGQATAMLVLQSSLGDYGGSYPFVVTAMSPGWSASARATLVLNGFDRPTGGDNTTPVYGTAVVATPDPANVGPGGTARVTLATSNVGTLALQYVYTPGAAPSGWNVTFENNNVVTAAGAALAVIADISVPTGVVPGDYTVGVDLYASNGYVGRTNFTVTVINAGVTLALSPASGTASTPFGVLVTNTGANGDTFDLSGLGPLGPVVTFSSNAVTLAAGATQTVTATLGAAGYLPPGGSSFDVVAVSRANAAASARVTAQVQLATSKGVALRGVPVSVTLAATPGAGSFAVQLQNAGNVEDTYSLSITATSANVTASLRDAGNAPVQAIAAVLLPGQGLGQFALDGALNSGLTGTVTVKAQSQTDATVSATLTLTLNASSVPVASMSAAPNPLVFGSQAVGTTSGVGTAVLTNSGTAAFNLSTLGLGGSNASDFALGTGANACAAGASVAANGGTCTLYVTFTPSGSGARGATVTATDTVAGISVALVLSGTGAGVTPPPPPPAATAVPVPTLRDGMLGALVLALLALVALRTRRI